MIEQIEVRSATEADLTAVTEILDSAAGWLIDQGIHQWPHPYPHAPSERALADRTLWVGSRNGRIVATMRTPRHDPEVWGEDPLPALYIHALASSRDPAARGSGIEMLRWAVRTAAADGLAAVRLDCWAGNHALRRYYERAGFRHVDDIEAGQGWRCSRFEMACPVP
jgi:RimJ/RimL family protein N-acetyltransferase